MCAFVPAAAAALTVLAGAHATEIGTSPPPALKYTDFVLDGKTTYCYSVKEGPAAAMFQYTQLGAEGKGEECPVQLSLEQIAMGDVNVNENVAYKLTATVNVSDKSLFRNATALTKPMEDPITKKLVQISSVSLHACSSTSVCDAFRKGNNSRSSTTDETATFTDGKATFTPALNFTSADTYTVFAVVVLPGPSDLDETMRFVAYTTTTVGFKNGGDNVENSNAPKVPTPSPTTEKKSAASTPAIAATMAAGVALAASLLL